ncbi:OsmC family protein [Variovorax sp. J22R133]|uniref:OsmC family protein n=1 Tax=Variovorax brevis TaxID=3053503 RepID=UPI002576C78B|nr:OsmC family protein [Variovorax sp. J22R133]MDM0116550.1 OsmC family protein [Variovorax sp. J22R133]
MHTSNELAAALNRAKSVLERRPEMGLHDDASATAHWTGGTRVNTRHANGAQFETDLPAELGGTGDRVTPGWLFRAGLASCAATSIAMAAATEGIELTGLEVRADSRSDTRGMLGMAEADGHPVSCGPQEVRLRVRIAAPGVPSHRLRKLVEEACRRSPVPNAVTGSVPLLLHIDDVDG